MALTLLAMRALSVPDAKSSFCDFVGRHAVLNKPVGYHRGLEISTCVLLVILGVAHFALLRTDKPDRTCD